MLSAKGLRFASSVCPIRNKRCALVVSSDLKTSDGVERNIAVPILPSAVTAVKNMAVALKLVLVPELDLTVCGSPSPCHVVVESKHARGVDEQCQKKNHLK